MMTDQSVSRFWDKYIKKTMTCGVKPDAQRWYVRHAEAYIKVHSGIKLALHSAENVDKYLKEKGRNKRLQDWQFKQIVKAIRLLFTEMVQVSWAKTFPWDDWINLADTLPANHATVARDSQSRACPASAASALGIDIESIAQGLLDKSNKNNGLFRQVFTQYPEHIQNLIKRIRIKHYSIRTEHSYLGWFLRYVRFHSMQDPANLSEPDISSFLEYLVINRQVSSSTQAQALNAVIFFYKQVLQRDLSESIEFIRSKKPRRLPVVLSCDEISRLLSKIESPTHHLMTILLYGCGMRLMECVRLRVLDVDFDYQQIVIREAKGKKDRVVPIPAKLIDQLRLHIQKVSELHKEDIAEGFGNVYLPHALARKYPNAI